jgi:hypothetical protein
MGRGCRSVAQSKNDPALAQKCADLAKPAESALVVAAAGVDAWSDADQKNVPCALADAVSALPSISALATSLGVPIPPVAAQGLEMAEALLPQCVRPVSPVDAGDGG